MREHNRPINKVELVLDGRKLIYSIAAALVALVIFFSLGVLIGKRLTGVAVDQQNLENLAEVDANEKKFQQEKAEIAKLLEESAKVKEATKVEEPAKAKELPKDLAKVTGKEKSATLPDKKKSKIQKETLTKIAAVAAKAKAEAKAKNKLKQKAKTKAKPKPVAKSKPKAEQKKQATASSTPAPIGKHYSIQILSLASKDAAEKYLAKYKAFDSRKPYIVAVEISGKGTWYRLKIGKFKTKEQALAYQSIFESRTPHKGTILALD